MIFTVNAGSSVSIDLLLSHAPPPVTVTSSDMLSELAMSSQSLTALPGEILTHFWKNKKVISHRRSVVSL